ncbi:MAG: helix-turn-helix domain-containing protein [Chloroflexota bacterium]
MDDLEEQKWYTIAEAAEYIRVTTATVYNYMKSGKLPYYYLAETRNRRVKQNDLDALLVLGSPDDVDEGDSSKQ